MSSYKPKCTMNILFPLFVESVNINGKRPFDTVHCQSTCFVISKLFITSMTSEFIFLYTLLCLSQTATYVRGLFHCQTDGQGGADPAISKITRYNLPRYPSTRYVVRRNIPVNIYYLCNTQGILQSSKILTQEASPQY